MPQTMSAPVTAEARSSSLVFSGILTGQISGLIMAVVVMAVFALFLGRSPLFPVQVIGSTLVGPAALHGFNLTALLVGLLLHQLGPSLLWGTLFGLLAKPFAVTSAAQSLRLGVAIGIVAMVGPYLLIPLVMKILQGVDYWAQEVPIAWDWAAHIVFGASFVLFPLIRKRLER